MRFFVLFLSLLAVSNICGCGGTIGNSSSVTGGDVKMATKVILQNGSDAALNMWLDDERLENDNIVGPGAKRIKNIEVTYDAIGGWGAIVIYIGRDGKRIKRESYSTFSYVHPTILVATYQQTGEISFKEAR